MQGIRSSVNIISHLKKLQLKVFKIAAMTAKLDNELIQISIGNI